MFKPIHFRLLQLLITLALILCIVGATSSISPTGVYQPQVTTKAGEALYTVAFVAIALIAIVIMHKLGSAPGAEKGAAWGVLLALPFILTRMCYSIIWVFTHNSRFNLITGSVVIHVLMAVLEEMIVVFIYLVVGLRSQVLPRTDKGAITSRPWKGRLAAGDVVKGHSRRTRRQGPIHALVRAAVQQHEEGQV